jgi:MoxR-like ATPase
MAALDRLAAVADGCELADVRPALAAAIRRLRAAGVGISDRRAVRAQRLVAAAAALDARDVATVADLWVLPLIVPAPDAQAAARDVLADLLEKSENASLTFAAEEFSRSAAARARRLAEAGEGLLAAYGAAPEDRDVRLRFEAALREIDAGFAAEDLGEPLAGVRRRLVDAVRADR